MATKQQTADLKKEFLLMYANTLGEVTAACKRLNIHRNTYYHWIKTDQDFAGDVDTTKQEIKDWGETQLKVAMQGLPIRDPETHKITDYKLRPSVAAIIFFNKTQNKDRGYVERVETTEVGGVNIIVKSEEDKKLLEEIEKIDEP